MDDFSAFREQQAQNNARQKNMKPHTAPPGRRVYALKRFRKGGTSSTFMEHSSLPLYAWRFSSVLSTPIDASRFPIVVVDSSTAKIPLPGRTQFHRAAIPKTGDTTKKIHDNKPNGETE